MGLFLFQPKVQYGDISDFAKFRFFFRKISKLSGMVDAKVRLKADFSKDRHRFRAWSKRK